MGTILKTLFFTGMMLLLASCTDSREERIAHPGFFTYQTKLFEIQVPANFTYSEFEPLRQYYYFGYPDGVTNGMSIVKFFVEVPNCNSSITGASHTEILENTNGDSMWGRVDVWEKFGEGDIPDWENVICRKDGIPPPDEVYALCSEKDGKRILICISQMTDNPQLAEEIFGTFRWED